MRGWSKLRSDKHDAVFPPEERRERRRQATIRYRERHAETFKLVRAVSAILLRREWRHDDIPRLAGSLRELLGPEMTQALRIELGRRKH